MMSTYFRRGGCPVSIDEAHSDGDAPEHRHEQPEDWGWHAEFGKWARAAGVLCIGALIVLNFTTRYSRTEMIWVDGFAALLAILLGLDWHRRKNAWRS
jgi:hypothetical protein